MVHTDDKQYELHCLYIKRGKMEEKVEQGFSDDLLKEVFKMDMQGIINEIARVRAELDKEFKKERYPVDDEMPDNYILDAGLSFLPLKAIS